MLYVVALHYQMCIHNTRPISDLLTTGSLWSHPFIMRTENVPVPDHWLRINERLKLLH